MAVIAIHKTGINMMKAMAMAAISRTRVLVLARGVTWSTRTDSTTG